jgi:hypothetical protein
LLKFESLLLKAKLNLLNYYFLILQHSFKLIITNFLDQRDIKVALHEYV